MAGLAARVTGRVGANAPFLRVRQVFPDVVRVTCENNRDFWLEIDLSDETAVGNVPEALERLPGELGTHVDYRVQLAHGVLCVRAEICPPFWLELFLGTV
jgi:hypothetical protein